MRTTPNPLHSAARSPWRTVTGLGAVGVLGGTSLIGIGLVVKYQ